VIQEIEAAIVSRLKSSITDLLVDSFPDKPAEYERLPFQKGVILVAYRGSRFSEPLGEGVAIQIQTAQFDVYLQKKDLRTHDGAYAYLEKIRELLTGFQPLTNVGLLYPISEDFLDMTDFLWSYGITFACRLKHLVV